ncbi:CsbD family protein [Fructilactobacillus myrtifloralis]|uniref:CsbD family protein n=1 Tax=Fructilactobacillus myrtifloralis TaxID=2940301 RepID=A0ABY5BSX3_9LACO|nr:CsbD family protein [Fructilactobacillus myrtifloralis]USS85691.1 CsbD family protein [Fructilactobacillus myrtifloralis]
MKDLFLGISLAANAALGYLLLKDTDALNDLSDKFEDLSSKAAEKIDSFTDQAEGKAKQVEGAVKDDPKAKLEGDFENGKGIVKDKVNDAKDALTD